MHGKDRLCISKRVVERPEKSQLVLILCTEGDQMFGTRHSVLTREHPRRHGGATKALRHLGNALTQRHFLIFGDEVHDFVHNVFVV